MTQATLDIELIVREVLRELGLPAGAPPACASAPAAVAPPPEAVPSLAVSPSISDQLIVTQSPVTLAALAGRLEGVRQVVVSPGAVVTPAVHDELYRHNISLSFAVPEATEQKPGTLRLSLVTVGKRFDPATLVSALRGTAVEIDSTQSDCLMAASDRLAAAVTQENTLGALVTRHTAAALCVANRLAGVRAICVSDAGRLAAAAEAVGANVLVLDPQSGLFTMKRLLAEFCRDGVRACPEVFQKRLG